MWGRVVNVITDAKFYGNRLRFQSYRIPPQTPFTILNVHRPYNSVSTTTGVAIGGAQGARAAIGAYSVTIVPKMHQNTSFSHQKSKNVPPPETLSLWEGPHPTKCPHYN